MAPKYPRSEAQAAKDYEGEGSFVTWGKDDEAGRALAVQTSARTLEECNGIYRSSAGMGFQDFSNILPGISGRPGLTRNGYNAFRPGEAAPSTHRDISIRCNTVYHSVGLIKNVIDLMSDFTSQGIRLCHPNKKIEKFFNNWFKKVQGQERSERFANNLYRNCNVIVRKQTAKVGVRVADKLYKTHAEPDLENSEIQPLVKVEKREIPWKYTFLDPATVITVGGSLASFVGNPLYAIQLPNQIRRQINSPRTEAEKQIVAQLPDDIKNAAKTMKPYLLPQDKTMVFHYKKDDWETWSYPIIYSIFKDAVAYEKMKLADIAALDGAISNVRIFKLGNFEHRILPTPAAAARLNSILASHTGAGTLDIIWTPDIELVESKSEVYKFLGEEKYKPILNALYAGLGIPPTLTGTYGAAGTTNNFISLKTLTERLEYGRRVLLDFWSKEIALVQQAMGFRFPATIEFDLMNLGDEEAVKMLYIHLADRNIISDETLQRMFGYDPDMEKVRINREARDRDNGRMTNKTGPYFEPIATQSLKKIALQQGSVAPSQVGIDLPPPKEGERPLMDVKHEQDMQKQELANKAKIAQKKMTKGPSGQGRPKGKKDTGKRKTKKFSPRSKAAIAIWAMRAQAEIADILNPGLLAQYNKRNMRMLSTTEAEQAERVKFGVLSEMEPFSTISEESVQNALKPTDKTRVMQRSFAHYLADVNSLTQKSPSMDDVKHIQSYVYANYYGADNE